MKTISRDLLVNSTWMCQVNSVSYVSICNDGVWTKGSYVMSETCDLKLIFKKKKETEKVVRGCLTAPAAPLCFLSSSFWKIIAVTKHNFISAMFSYIGSNTAQLTP